MVETPGRAPKRARIQRSLRSTSQRPVVLPEKASVVDGGAVGQRVLAVDVSTISGAEVDESAGVEVEATATSEECQKAAAPAVSTTIPLLWELPDAVLFHIVGFVAGRTRRASVLCHVLAPLCRSAKTALLNDEMRAGLLWQMVLKEDYEVDASSAELLDKSSSRKTQRRSCQRLRKSVMQQVQSAHQLIKDNTEIAYFYLSELCQSSSGANSKATALTKSNLCQILDEYGPHLRTNEPVSSGGLFLVEVCRARRTSEANMLKCVKTLIETYGASPHPSTNEANNCYLTALSVASARGLPKVVACLLEKGASVHTRSSGRFRLYTRPRADNHQQRQQPKSIRCNNATPLEFATAMREAEAKAGASTMDLKGLDRCIQLLHSTEQKRNESDATNSSESRAAEKDGKRATPEVQSDLGILSPGPVRVRVRWSVALPRTGPLGLRLSSSCSPNNTNDDINKTGTFVTGMHKRSSLVNVVGLGDQIVMVGKHNVSTCTAAETSSRLLLLDEKGKQRQQEQEHRTLTVLSKPMLAEVPVTHPHQEK